MFYLLTPYSLQGRCHQTDTGELVNALFEGMYKNRLSKGWGQSVKLGKHSAIWGKLGTALQAYALNPCTKFPPNPTSRKVNT